MSISRYARSCRINTKVLGTSSNSRLISNPCSIMNRYREKPKKDSDEDNKITLSWSRGGVGEARLVSLPDPKESDFEQHR